MRPWKMVLPLLAAIGLSAFEPVVPGYEFAFPRDHFEHPRFEHEWWYYTGNLRDSSGRPFGFELTFFRLAVEPGKPPETAWDVSQVYLAHLAVSDVASGKFHRAERINRRGPGLAGASETEKVIWNGNWSATWEFDRPGRPAQRLQAAAAGMSIDLQLDPSRPFVIHGEDGIARKQADGGTASHYVSFTRLRATGRLGLDGELYDVEGSAWMDHEFSTGGLAEGQTGWTWLSIQLDDGNDLMVYGMRDAQGNHDAFTFGTFVDRDGQKVSLAGSEFTLSPGRTWRSSETGAEYPVEWSLEIPKLGYRLACQPLMDRQEVVSPRNAAPVYWEGAVRYRGDRRGEPVKGVGYLEMTGYDKPVELGVRDSPPEGR